MQRLFICAAMIGLALPALGQKLPCGVDYNTIRNMSSAEALAFLARAQPIATAYEQRLCIRFALESLDTRNKPDEIPLLLSYLTFYRPATPLEKEGACFDCALIYGQYPAIVDLAVEGAPAREPLIDIIRRSNSTLERSNATKALLLSFRRPQTAADGVRLLRQKAAQSADAFEAEHLVEATQFSLSLTPCRRLGNACLRAYNESANAEQ